MLREMGATPLVVDILDPEAVARAVAEFEPDVIVHEATALSSVDMRHFERSFAGRTGSAPRGPITFSRRGAPSASERFVAQSFAGWPFARTGSLIKTEDDPLDPNPIEAMRTTIAAIRYLEAAVLGADWSEGIALRYGGLYGPGTSLDSAGGEMTEMIRRRFFPIVGDGNGMFSFIHVADAADATLAAVERGTRGVYHIVDDEPAPIREWLPVVADRLGAKPPFRHPALAGSAGRRRDDRHDVDRDPRRLERAGQARARMDAAPRVVAGQPGAERPRDRYGGGGGARGPAAARLRDRVPDARQRGRGGGRRPGPFSASTASARRARRSTRRSRTSPRSPPAWRSTTSGRPGCAASTTWATGSRSRSSSRRRGPRAARRDARLALVRVPGRARAPLARATGGPPPRDASATGTRRSPRSST